MKKRFASLPNHLLLLAVLFTGLMKINAQLPDGTNATADFYTVLNENLAEDTAQSFDTSKVSTTTTLSIYVHVINNVNGSNGGVTEQLVAGFLSDVNVYFKPIGVKFQIGGFQTVMEYEYSSVIDDSTDTELLTKFAVDKVINLFLVDTILFENISYYGFTFFPNDTLHNNIFIRKDHAFEKPLITQLGHFFGLLSTYDIGTGQERVDGSNCHIAGDLICDTYADPGIPGSVNSSCEYNGNSRDPVGEFYVPSVANFMTNSPFPCKCLFSAEQYRRMHYYYKNYRSYLR